MMTILENQKGDISSGLIVLHVCPPGLPSKKMAPITKVRRENAT
jgi:hypothetical protein